eukprot:g8736.t1
MFAFWNLPYIALRFSLWWILWFIVHLDAFRNRTSRGRGWRLQRGILTFLSAEVVFQSIHLAAVIEHENQKPSWDSSTSRIFRTEVFFDWLAKSIFLCLLLLISSGYCIIRDNLTGHKARVFGMPVVYGVTSMVFDYVLLSSDNEQVVTQQVDAEDQENNIDSRTLRAFLLVVCLMVKLVVFVSAWVIVFESLNAALQSLEVDFHEEAVITAEEVEEDGEYTRPSLQDVADDIVDGRSPDEPKTVAEVVGDQAKKLLLTRFRNAIIVYVVATIIDNVLPIFITYGSIQTMQSVVIVVENLILYAFVAALAIIFRPVGDNPYLLLVDDFEEEGGKEITTELGVIAEDSAPDPRTLPVEEKEKEIVRTSTGNFSLGGEEILDVVDLGRQDSERSTPRVGPDENQTLPLWSSNSPSGNDS